MREKFLKNLLEKMARLKPSLIRKINLMQDY